MAVVVIVGLARSGKDTVADYIAQKYGYAKYTFSDVLKEMLEEKGIPPKKKKMIELGDMLRGQSGMDIVARLLDKKIREEDNLLLVGPRSIEEIEYFRMKFPDLKVVKVVARTNQRFQRKSELDPNEKGEFYDRDAIDLENKGFSKVIEAADYQINNFSTTDDLYKETGRIMEVVTANES